MIGQTISHYKILEKIGEGGMGVVYKAHDTTLDREVALKFLPSDLTRDPNARERFIHEAKAASALEHTNICSVHEIGEHEGRTFIVMGYYEGESLKKKIDTGPVQIDEAVNITREIAQGLTKAHDAGIIHRDIKPANIIVTKDGDAKILDFGLAKVSGRTLLTKSGTTLGTAAYMSPEQARGEAVDKRTDIWSLGVTMYEMITGKRPFASEYEQALVYSILNEEPKPMRDVRAEVPESLEKICLRAMAKDANDRYQTGSELITDLESYKAGSQLSQKTQKVRSKRGRFIYVGLAVILVAVAVALIFDPFKLRFGVEQNIAGARPSLAVISFENIPDPTDKEYMGEMLTNLLITALFETKDLEVISRERLYDIQKDMGQGESKVISATTASQIARRAGVSSMLLGSILQVQPTLTVTYRVIDVQSGKIINTKRVGGYQSDRLFSLVDTLALMVKSDLNFAPSASAPARSVVEVTTKSPEAYRAYLEGVEMIRRLEYPRSYTVMQKAIDLDSTFAMPHYHLGFAWSDQAEIRRAWDLRANATEKERLQIEALYLSSVGENPARAAQMLEQISQKYPHEQSVYGQSAGNYSGYLCEYDRALEVLERGLRSDSSDKFLWNELGYLLAGYNNRSQALHAMDKYVQLAPTEFNPYDSRGDVLLALGEPDSAIQFWQEALVFGSSRSIMKVAYQYILRRDYTTARDNFRKAVGKADELGKAFAERETVLVSVHRGELIKARRLFSRYVELHRRNKLLQAFVAGAPGLAAGGDLLYLVTLSYEEGDYEGMLRYARERSVILPGRRLAVPFDPTSPIYGRYEVAWALLKNGRGDESSRLMDELKKVQRPGLPQRQREYDYFAALFAMERGEDSIALEQFTKSLKGFLPNHAPQYHYAVALLKSGRTTEAIAEFQRMTWWSLTDDIISTPLFSPMYTYWPIAAVKAHYWLGVAYEQQGKRTEAIREYETFLDIWKDADFKSREMQVANKRLAILNRVSMN
jgi:eukaryotic-like serine/threonine-protein kinase